jgi:hypothetical protein
MHGKHSTVISDDENHVKVNLFLLDFHRISFVVGVSLTSSAERFMTHPINHEFSVTSFKRELREV